MAQPSQIIMLGMGPGNNRLQFMTCGLGADTETAEPEPEPTPETEFWTPQTATTVTWTTATDE